MSPLTFRHLKPPKSLFLFLLLLIAVPAISQDTVYFEYDNAGNQIERSLSIRVSTTNEADEIVELIEEKLDTEDQLTEGYVKYYPNPVKDYLYLHWENANNHSLKSITLFNSIGQQVGLYTVQPSDITETLNLSSFPQGVYMLILNYTNGEIKSIKIIKE